MVFSMGFGMGFSMVFGMGLTEEEFILLQLKTKNRKILKNLVLTRKYRHNHFFTKTIK